MPHSQFPSMLTSYITMVHLPQLRNQHQDVAINKTLSFTQIVLVFLEGPFLSQRPIWDAMLHLVVMFP